MQFPVKLDGRFLKKSYARRMFYGLWKLALAYLVILIFVGTSYSDPKTKGFCIFLLAVVGLGTSIFIFAWLRQAKWIEDWASKQGEAPVSYALSEEAVESASQLGSTKLKWEAFSTLVISDFDILLVFPRSAGALTLPTEQMPGAAIDYLKNRFTASGKKVEDKRKRANQSPQATPSARG
jgi:hypothetical protein